MSWEVGEREHFRLEGTTVPPWQPNAICGSRQKTEKAIQNLNGKNQRNLSIDCVRWYYYINVKLLGFINSINARRQPGLGKYISRYLEVKSHDALNILKNDSEQQKKQHIYFAFFSLFTNLQMRGKSKHSKILTIYKHSEKVDKCSWCYSFDFSVNL